MFWLLVAGSFVVCLSTPTDKTKEAWREVNAYLSSQEDDVWYTQILLKRALEWLREIERACSPMCQPQNEVIDLLEELEQFHLIIKGRKCGLEEHNFRVDFVDRAMSMANDRNAVLRRVIIDCAREMAIVCQLEFAKSYLQLEKSFANDPRLEPMHMFLMEIIAHTLTGSFSRRFNLEGGHISAQLELSSNEYRAQVYENFIESDSILATRSNALIAFEAVDSLVRKTDCASEIVGQVKLIDGIQVFGPETAKEIFEKKIESPCTMYLRLVGPNLFEVANRDLEYLTTIDIAQMEGEGVGEYYLAWAEYMLCMRLVYLGEDREKLLELIGEVASEAEAEVRPREEPQARLKQVVSSSDDAGAGPSSSARTRSL